MDRTLDEQKNILRKYLLHDLEEAEQEQVEVRLLTDKDFTRLMAIAQNDLIDDFVSAKLSERDVKNFREQFLTTPERLQKVKFATALDRYVSEKQPTQTGVLDRLATFFRVHPLKATGWATGLLLVFGATLFIVFRAGWFQQGYDQRIQEALVLANRFQSADTTPLSELKRNSENVVALTLSQNLVRENGQPRRVEVGRGVTLIRLLLQVPPDPYDSYNIVLQTVAGKEIAATGGLGARSEDGAQFVVINLPAEFLAPNDYRLKLTGISAGGQSSDVGLYPFQVTNR